MELRNGSQYITMETLPVVNDAERLKARVASRRDWVYAGCSTAVALLYQHVFFKIIFYFSVLSSHSVFSNA